MTEMHAHVTATQPDGTSYFISSGPVPPVEVLFQPGTQFFQLWGTPASGAEIGGPVQATTVPFFPTGHGSRALVVRFPGRTEGGADFVMGGAEVDRESLRVEAEAKLPGLFAAHEADDVDAAFHATETLDYVFVLYGRLRLELDGGEAVSLEQGDCVVQRGTLHKWSNSSEEPAAMAVVLISAERLT